MKYSVETNALAIGYGKAALARDIALGAAKGQVLALIGPNGAGKSTLLKTLAGQLAPLGGAVLLDGQELARIPGNARAQKLALMLPHTRRTELTTCFEFAAAGRIPYTGRLGILSAEDKKQVQNALELVGAAHLADRDFNCVSDGQRQRVLLARALCQEPEILVLDEPNSGLDPRARVEMKELLQNLRGMGKTIVISSHILSELAEMCNSIGIMDHGKLVEAGNIEDVMEHVFGGNRIVVSVHGEMEPAVRMLKEHPQIKVESVGEKEIHISHAMKEEEIAQLIAQMIQNGIIVTGFYKEEGNLESLFMQLTGGQEDEN